MDSGSESSPPLENTQRHQLCHCSSCPGSLPGYPVRIPPIELIINVRQIPPSVQPVPQPAPYLPIAPQKEVNQDKEGIVCRVQDRIIRLKERCQITLKNLYPRKLDKGETESFCNCEKKENLFTVQEEVELYTSENKKLSMEKIQLRPRPPREGLYSKEWANRLTDYSFLSGKNEELPKRSTQINQKVKRTNRRATVMVPQITRRLNGQGYKCSKCELVTHKSCLNGVQLCDGRARHESSNDVYPGYGNLHLQQYAWWVGKMTREKSTEVLDHQPEGTFLIRWSDRNQKLVLSLRFGYEVKHMRIMKQEETNSFYLSEVRYFRTLERLVSYYREKSLSECFSDLYANLTNPLYEVAIANHSYDGTESNRLSLNPGDRVIVISHDGENIGWWKGRIENREGYFPKNFVTVQDSSF